MRRNRSFVLAIVAAVALALAMAACAQKVTLSAELGADGNSRTYTADSCKAEDTVMTNFEVEEGQSKLVVHSKLTQGTLHFKLGGVPDVDAVTDEVDEGQAPDADALANQVTDVSDILDFDVTQTEDKTFDVEPGSYSLQVSGDDASPATGTVSVSVE